MSQDTKHDANQAGETLAALGEVNFLRSVLLKVLQSDVGRQTLLKLRDGQGSDTEDGRAWLNADQVVSPLTGGVPQALESLADTRIRQAVMLERARCTHLANYALTCAKRSEWESAADAVSRIKA